MTPTQHGPARIFSHDYPYPTHPYLYLSNPRLFGATVIAKIAYYEYHKYGTPTLYWHHKNPRHPPHTLWISYTEQVILRTAGLENKLIEISDYRPRSWNGYTLKQSSTNPREYKCLELNKTCYICPEGLQEFFGYKPTLIFLQEKE